MPVSDLTIMSVCACSQYVKNTLTRLHQQSLKTKTKTKTDSSCRRLLEELQSQGQK